MDFEKFPKNDYVLTPSVDLNIHTLTNLTSYKAIKSLYILEFSKKKVSKKKGEKSPKPFLRQKHNGKSQTHMTKGQTPFFTLNFLH